MKNTTDGNTLGLVAFAALTFVACKQEASAPYTQEAPVVAEKAEVAPTTPAPQPAEPVAPAIDPKADFIRVRVSHNPPKDGDPVEVGFGKFSVTSVSMPDTNKLVGAKAEVEIDLTSLTSGIVKRDEHLKSPDYLEAGVFHKGTIKISDVKKADGENSYTAKVAIDVHGVKKVMTVAFETVEVTDEGIRAAGEHTFKRSDFGVGKAEGDTTAGEVTLQFQLSFKKS